MTYQEKQQIHFDAIAARRLQLAAEWMAGTVTIRQLSQREHLGQDRIRDLLHSVIPAEQYEMVRARHEKESRDRNQKRFQPGHHSWITGRHICTRKDVKRPIGTVVIRRHKCSKCDGEGRPQWIRRRFIKVSNRKGRSGRKGNWVPFCRWVYEQHNGPVPDGAFVIHDNGDTMDDNPGNLLLVTRSQLARRTTELCDTEERAWKTWETRFGSARMAQARAEKEATLRRGVVWEEDVDDDWLDEEAA